MVEIDRSLPLGKDLIFANNPSMLVLVDSRNKQSDIVTLDKVHRALGMKMFGYHYYVARNGDIYAGRPERAFSCDVEVLMQHVVFNKDSTTNESPFPVSNLEFDTAGNIISAGRIFICAEGNTEVADFTDVQRSSIIALCKDIRSRNRNIRNVYSLTEFVPELRNLGIFVDMNKLRSEIMSTIVPAYISTPSGVISYTFGKRELYYDSDKPISGNDVKLLQHYLMSLGIPVTNPSGEYDLFTYEAVKEFQKRTGLDKTGRMKQKDYEKLNELMYLTFSKNKDFSTYHRMLYYRHNNTQKGDDVNRLQDKLKGLRLAEKSGRFDVQTDIAVRNYQRKNGLVVDGLVGPITWRMIMGSANVDFYRPLRLEEPNMRGGDVKIIQERIRDFRKRFGIVKVTTNGIYDETTKKNIMKIQSIANFPINGIVDDLLFNYIMELK